MGRSRALSLTVLTYAVFTGLGSVAQTWWQLLIFRFLAALGIGGEWAVGSSLLAETWPRRWRPWIAAVLQTGVNVGILGACLAYYLYVRVEDQNPRYLFLVGVLPALLVFWIRRAVPETEEWRAARASAPARLPGIGELFQGGARRTTWLTIAVCATSLTAWWAFIFWNPQHLRNLPDLAGWSLRDREQFVSKAFFVVIGTSILGNFFAGWLAGRVGYRRSLAMMFGAFVVVMTATYAVPRTHESLMRWIPWIGFCSGCFGLFTMYLPPLFPTLLRTTGAGFCYNIGRVAAAAGTVGFGLFAPVGDFRLALLYDGWLFLPALVGAWLLPEVRDGDREPAD
jgi:MFS family permease